MKKAILRDPDDSESDTISGNINQEDVVSSRKISNSSTYRDNSTDVRNDLWVHVTCSLLSPDVRIMDYRYMSGLYMKSDLAQCPPPSTSLDAPPVSPSVERQKAEERSRKQAAEAARMASFRRSSRTVVVEAYKRKEKQKREAQECSLCGKRGGYVTSCPEPDCAVQFHPLCAWYKGNFVECKRCPIEEELDNGNGEDYEPGGDASSPSLKSVSPNTESPLLFRRTRANSVVTLKVWCHQHDPASSSSSSRYATQIQIRSHYRIRFPVETFNPGGISPASRARRRKTAAEQREARILKMQRLGQARANGLMGGSSPTRREKLAPYDSLRGPPLEPDVFDNGVCAICFDYNDLLLSSQPLNSTSASGGDLTLPKPLTVVSEGTDLVTCATCGVCVHRSCYGFMDEKLQSESGPDGMSQKLFHCYHCTRYAESAPTSRQRCELCPRSGGAYIELDKKSNLWVHSFCMYWTPGAYFQKPSLLSGPVITDIHKSRFQIKCSLCKRGGTMKTSTNAFMVGFGRNKLSTRFEGACVQCAHDGCHVAMHPNCCRQHKLYMTMKDDISNEGVIHKTIECYCAKHTPSHLEYSEEQRAYVHSKATLDVSRSYLALQSYRADLDMLRTLCDLTRKREKLKLRLGKHASEAFERERCKLEAQDGPTARRTRKQIEDMAARREEKKRLREQKKREEEEQMRREEEERASAGKIKQRSDEDPAESDHDESADSDDESDDSETSGEDSDASNSEASDSGVSGNELIGERSVKKKKQNQKKTEKQSKATPLPPPPPPLPEWAQPQAFEINGYDETDIFTGTPETGYKPRTEDIEAIMGHPTTTSTKVSALLRVSSIIGLPPSVGTLGKSLLFEVMDGVVQRRSASREHNTLDFQLLEIFNSVDQAECEYTDGSMHSLSEHFQSVPTSLEAKLYHEIIEDPISLSNIYTGIQRGKYASVASLTKDIKRCIKNAKKYNHAQSEIYKDAQGLEKVLLKAISKQSAQTLERDLATKIANVRRRQARKITAQRQDSPRGRPNKRMEQEDSPVPDTKNPTSSAQVSSLSSNAAIFTSKHRLCFLCKQYEMPDLPGPSSDHPVGAWYCEDCRVNPANNSNSILGKRVAVWWDNDRQYYRGRVTAYEPRSGQHRIYYDVDHDWEFLDLSKQKIVFLLHEDD